MLAQSAAILRDEDALLDDLARRALHQARAVQLDRPTGGPSDRRAVQPPDGPTARPLDRRRLAALPPALQRRVVRLWLLDAGHADAAGWTEVERLLACVGDANNKVLNANKQTNRFMMHSWLTNDFMDWIMADFRFFRNRTKADGNIPHPL